MNNNKQHRGIIYKISPTDELLYIGSTTQVLCDRQSSHNHTYRQDKFTDKHKLYSFCKQNNIDKILCIWVADIEYDSVDELRAIEKQYYIELSAKLNTNRPLRT